MVTTLALFSAACESSGPSDSEVLINIADDIAVPAYQAVAQDMAQLNQAVEAFCTLPNGSTLEAARQSWRDARASWMASEALWFGPVIDRRSQSLLDWSPTDVEGVEQLLARSAPLTVEEVGQSLASNQRGFGAIEYGLFHGDALAAFAGSPLRCSSLLALTSVAQEEAAAILAEWVEGADRGAPYHSYFTSRSNPGLLESAAVAELVRTQVFLIRDIVDMRLASALGLRDEAADLSTIPGNAADNGLQDLRYEIQGMQVVYEGAGPNALGISALVLPLSEDTDERLRDQFAAAIAAIESVDGPLRVAITNRPESVNDVYERLDDLLRTMATELVSLLGISVGFTDTDGDSLR